MDNQPSRSNNEKAFVSKVARIILSKTGDTALVITEKNLFYLALFIYKLIAIALVC